MPDMLVKLYNLPEPVVSRREMAKQKIRVRPALVPEKHVVLPWIEEHFNPAWASEADVAFTNQPVSILLAIDEQLGKIAGFACYEVTMRNFFGPFGVAAPYRGRGIGKALFLEGLHGLRQLGYAYCIIGGAGPIEFYSQISGAIVIEGSRPGIYKGLLKNE